MEKILENTAFSITTLSTTVSELLRESTSHKEKILNLGKNVAALQQENRQLKEVCMGMQNYKRRWDLRIYGVKESGPDKESNTRDTVIKILSKVSTKIALKLPDVVDSVHRLGQRRGDGRPRVIIIQFAMRLYRDTVWRDAKDNHYLKENPMGRLLFLFTDPITQQVSQFSSTNSKAMFWKLFVQIMEDGLY